jgi:hypothetical protein
MSRVVDDKKNGVDRFFNKIRFLLFFILFTNLCLVDRACIIGDKDVVIEVSIVVDELFDSDSFIAEVSSSVYSSK